jgi:hypothetical protein
MIQPNNRWLEPIASELTGPMVRGQISVLPDGPLRDLLLRVDTKADFERLARLDFQRLLEKDFIPRRIGQPKKFSISGGVPRGGGIGASAAADAIDVLGWIVLWGEVRVLLEELDQKDAADLGLTVDQFKMMRDDLAIIDTLTKVAEQTLTDAELELEKEEKKKRTTVKRTRIHGFSRKAP